MTNTKQINIRNIIIALLLVLWAITGDSFKKQRDIVEVKTDSINILLENSYYKYSEGYIDGNIDGYNNGYRYCVAQKNRKKDLVTWKLGYNTAMRNTNNYLSDSSKYNTVAYEFDDDNAILDMIDRATNE